MGGERERGWFSFLPTLLSPSHREARYTLSLNLRKPGRCLAAMSYGNGGGEGEAGVRNGRQKRSRLAVGRDYGFVCIYIHAPSIFTQTFFALRFLPAACSLCFLSEDGIIVSVCSDFFDASGISIVSDKRPFFQENGV